MAIEVKEVASVLAPLGLEPPDLELLRPTEASYLTMLLQPCGPVYMGDDRIGGLDSTLNSTKVLTLARLANQKGATLVVTPEYFTPWSAVRSLVEQGVIPAPGALWVLGCESVRQEQLEELKGSLADKCEFVYESIEALPRDRQLLNPVVLLFSTNGQDGEQRLVALVQFKTCPSRDPLFSEERLIKCGKRAYKFRKGGSSLSATVLICADALALNDELVRDLVDRSTLIHIQLNPNPRHSRFRQYRKTAFELNPDASNCHIVCLNWARTITVHNAHENKKSTWPATSCSTWYCPQKACSQSDEIVSGNHQLGVYYTYMSERRHSLLFDYDEAVFALRVPKVFMNGPAVLANNNGPRSEARFEWDKTQAAWVEQNEPRKADFDILLHANPVASSALRDDQHPVSALDVERLFALSTGAIGVGKDWYRRLHHIDSFCMNSDEVVRRITVAQDISNDAERFRHSGLDAVANIRHELDTCQTWPPQIAGTGPGTIICWDAATSQFNVRNADGKPALICYLGEAPSERDLENTPSKLIDLLRQSGKTHETRLCVIYRTFGNLKFAPLAGMTRFDDALTDERDILSTNLDGASD